MGYFRITMMESDGKIVEMKCMELPADTTEAALHCPEIKHMKEKAKKNKFAFRVTKEG